MGSNWMLRSRSNASIGLEQREKWRRTIARRASDLERVIGLGMVFYITSENAIIAG
jgi:hypothetical protein